jgi:uncharacterized membrane protein YeaQ/YmgE (transglycosylase-associated protein family)
LGYLWRVGWVASIIAGTNERQGCLMNIIIGVAGAFVGGLLSSLLFSSSVTFGWDIQSFAVAVLGAVLLLLIFRRRP